jgi:hypothetical protein
VKLSAVLLRWYKSFNLSYVPYPDRRAGATDRPWNRLQKRGDDVADFPFIEIPVEHDITTIVGANESGKSHLLSAVSKVLTGKGIPDGSSRAGAYDRTDLCHYMATRSKNAEDWPHIGVQFGQLSQDDLKSVGAALQNKAIGARSVTRESTLTLILAPVAASTVAHLYLDADQPLPLNEAKLSAVRSCLPRVEFLRSELSFADHIPIGTLLEAYGEGESLPVFEDGVAQEVARFISGTALPGDNVPLLQEWTKKLTGWQAALKAARVARDTPAELERLLFQDVMGITGETLKFVSALSLDQRTHADSLVAKWNREIDEKLSLAHYWQQDDAFALRLNYKQGIIFFEITDKTGATYTFRERSSGLRFFLSYYVQAKAMELTSRGRQAIVLMDEPDSFLSILGQQHLLAVFESLVRAESSGGTCQLIYSTHSPFLIDRNYPRRLRLVRKGHAEEGTQLVDQAMLRRYEPVRSALGIDCAQTLFMGATNLVVEGPTDQFLLAELVRLFLKEDTGGDLLDLNSLVMVSADSASRVEQLLMASQWGDEPLPATVVLLDSDDAGRQTRENITGRARGHKKLVDDSFVLQLAEILPDGIDGQKTVSSEDLVTPRLYAEGVVRYCKRWHGEKMGNSEAQLRERLAQPTLQAEGLAAGVTQILDEVIHEAPRSFDKMGVLEEVVELLSEGPVDFGEDVAEVRRRLVILCRRLRQAISLSQQAARKTTGKQSIQRQIDEFFKTNKEGTSVFEMQLVLERMQRDTTWLGRDGEDLEKALRELLEQVDKDRAAERKNYRDASWTKWRDVLQAIRRNPLVSHSSIADLVTEDPSQVASS